jgi:hypothetical protein
LDDDGDDDTIAVEITNDTADFAGTLTLNDHETISIDVTGSGDTTLVAINASSATTLTFTNDDTYVAAADLIVLAALDVDLDATIDLSDWIMDVGSFTVSTGATTTGLLAEASSAYTILIADGRTSGQEIAIDLFNTAGIDTFVFVDTTDDATNNIGIVAISNFGDRSSVAVTDADLIDLTAFGITSMSDLSIVAGTSAVITAVITAVDIADFDGSITLIGVAHTDLTADNFIFA